jgi:hypothetical protein
MSLELETIIGLEIHIQLNTKSKMFCGCANNSFDVLPNENICPICFGVVGTLPLMNQAAFWYSVKTGLALNCRIADHTKWDRKNYFIQTSLKHIKYHNTKSPWLLLEKCNYCCPICLKKMYELIDCTSKKTRLNWFIVDQKLGLILTVLVHL